MGYDGQISTLSFQIIPFFVHYAIIEGVELLNSVEQIRILNEVVVRQHEVYFDCALIECSRGKKGISGRGDEDMRYVRSLQACMRSF